MSSRNCQWMMIWVLIWMAVDDLPHEHPFFIVANGACTGVVPDPANGPVMVSSRGTTELKTDADGKGSKFSYDKGYCIWKLECSQPNEGLYLDIQLTRLNQQDHAWGTYRHDEIFVMRDGHKFRRYVRDNKDIISLDSAKGEVVFDAAGDRYGNTASGGSIYVTCKPLVRQDTLLTPAASFGVEEKQSVGLFDEISSFTSDTIYGHNIQIRCPVEYPTVIWWMSGDGSGFSGKRLRGQLYTSRKSVESHEISSIGYDTGKPGSHNPQIPSTATLGFVFYGDGKTLTRFTIFTKCQRRNYYNCQSLIAKNNSDTTIFIPNSSFTEYISADPDDTENLWMPKKNEKCTFRLQCPPKHDLAIMSGSGSMMWTDMAMRGHIGATFNMYNADDTRRVNNWWGTISSGAFAYPFTFKSAAQTNNETFYDLGSNVPRIVFHVQDAHYSVNGFLFELRCFPRAEVRKETLHMLDKYRVTALSNPTLPLSETAKKIPDSFRQEFSLVVNHTSIMAKSTNSDDGIISPIEQKIDCGVHHNVYLMLKRESGFHRGSYYSEGNEESKIEIWNTMVSSLADWKITRVLGAGRHPLVIRWNPTSLKSSGKGIERLDFSYACTRIGMQKAKALPYSTNGTTEVVTNIESNRFANDYLSSDEDGSLGRIKTGSTNQAFNQTWIIHCPPKEKPCVIILDVHRRLGMNQNLDKFYWSFFNEDSSIVSSFLLDRTIVDKNFLNVKSKVGNYAKMVFVTKGTPAVQNGFDVRFHVDTSMAVPWSYTPTLPKTRTKAATTTRTFTLTQNATYSVSLDVTKTYTPSRTPPPTPTMPLPKTRSKSFSLTSTLYTTFLVEVTPAMQVAITTVSATGAVAVASVGAPPDSILDMQGVFMVSMMGCDKEKNSASVLGGVAESGKKTILPFSLRNNPEYGPMAGSLIIIAGMWLIHSLVVVNRRGANRGSWMKGCAQARFPAYTFKINTLLYQGISYEALRMYVDGVGSGDLHPRAIGIALLGVCVVVGMPAAVIMWLNKNKKTIRFRRFYRTNSLFEKIPLKYLSIPDGHWLPPSRTKMYGCFFSSYRPHRELWLLVSFARCFCLAVLANMSSITCSKRLFVVAALPIIVCSLMIFLQPYRSRLRTVLSSISGFLSASVVMMAILPEESMTMRTRQALIEKLVLLMSPISVLNAAGGFLIARKERKWKTEYDSDEDPDDGHHHHKKKKKKKKKGKKKSKKDKKKEGKEEGGGLLAVNEDMTTKKDPQLLEQEENEEEEGEGEELDSDFLDEDVEMDDALQEKLLSSSSEEDGNATSLPVLILPEKKKEEEKVNPLEEL